jgi:hypothetical protein
MVSTTGLIFIFLALIVVSRYRSININNDNQPLPAGTPVQDLNNPSSRTPLYPTHNTNDTNPVKPTRRLITGTTQYETAIPGEASQLAVATQFSQSASPVIANTSTSPSITTTATIQPLATFAVIGNQKIDVSAWQEPVIISFAHDGAGLFKAISYNSLGEPLSTLVDVIGPYTGRQIMNTGGVHYSAIEVQAHGNWRVEIQPLTTAVLLELPTTIKGKNPEVFRLDRMTYEMTLDIRNVSDWVYVIGYGENGYFRIIADEVAPFKKTIIIKDPDITFLEINTSGNWTLDIR